MCGPWGLCVQKCSKYYNLIECNAGVFSGARFSSLRAPLKTPAWEANAGNDRVDQFTLDVSLEKTVNKSQRPAGIIATSDGHVLILFQTVLKPAQPEISNKTEISV